MAGEQPFHLNISPEENLTNIRERLEQIPDRLIVLIVPRQTRLRNLHSWNLLRRYADEMGKEIWVISDDGPIIDVARRAQFRVGSPGSIRRGSNPGRGAKSATARRDASNRGGVKGNLRSRQSPSTQQAPGAPYRPTTGPGPRPTPSPRPQPPAREQETGQIHISNLGEDDEPETVDLGPVSPSFGSHQSQGSRYEQPFDFRIVSQSPLRPVEATPEPGDEEMDSFPYDYEQSQKIFQAAQQKGEDALEDDTGILAGPDSMLAPHDRMTPPTERTAQENNPPPARRLSSPLSASLSRSAESLDDPFAMPDDFQPLTLSEQHGAAPVHPFDDEEEGSGISNYAAGGGTQAQDEIEDLGDTDMDALPPLDDEFLASPPWEQPEANEGQQAQEEEEYDDMPPVPFRPHSGQLFPASPGMETGAETGTPVSNAADTEEEEEIEDQPTRVIRPVLSLPDAVAAQNANRAAPEETAAERPPAVPQTPGRQGGPKPVDLPVRASARPSSPVKRSPALTKAKSRKPSVARRLRRGRRPGFGLLPVAIVVLLVAGIILFVFPSADVTVTLAAQSYSWPVIVTASTSQNLAQHTVPLYTVTYTASVTEKGNASGTNTTVGTAKASGIIQFTNNGTQPVLIPSGTIVSTTNNVLFATGAELLVTAGSTSPVPVQAQAPGTSGNVAANTITVIPPTSVSQIEQVKENQGVTVKLTVTNPNPTSGGGAGTATTVTQKDVNNLQSQANTQLYQKFQTWLTQQEARGNVLAKPVPESQLAGNETVKATPAAGEIASDGTFSAVVSLALQVKFVQSSDLRAQAAAQYHHLPTGTTKPPKGYEPVEGQPVQLQPASCSSSSKSSTANASTLCFTATAPVALPITAQEVQNLVNGKKVDLVRAQLANSKTGLPGIKAVKVNVSPSFWPWMPFWTQRIIVHLTTDLAH